MPSRNTIKSYDAPAYYHVYNRGAGGQKIFIDSTDKKKFLSLFIRHLSADYLTENPNSPYTQYNVELVSYCLMGNHFHLLLYQDDDPTQISKLMRSVSTAYSMYFNKKYRSQGHLFQSIFRASHINNNSYLQHITRYIHLNPRTYKTYYWSSLRNYIGLRNEDWVHTERVMNVTPAEYLDFLEDYEDYKALLNETKNQLAL